MGARLKAPLTSYDVIYTLPMLTIKEDKGVSSCQSFFLETQWQNIYGQSLENAWKITFNI